MKVVAARAVTVELIPAVAPGLARSSNISLNHHIIVQPKLGLGSQVLNPWLFSLLI